jgi:hypothetical protein
MCQDADSTPYLNITPWVSKFANSTRIMPFFGVDTIEALVAHEHKFRTIPEGVAVSTADIFLWRRKPSAKHTTQMGGCPFVEDGFQWPKIGEIPLVYWGSLYFGDSMEILNRSLPGDVLNLFLLPDGMFFEPDFGRAVWARSKVGHRMDPQSIPTKVVEPLYGVRFRTKLAVKLNEKKNYDPFNPSPAHLFISEARSAEYGTAIKTKHSFLEIGFEPYASKPVSSADLIALVTPFNPIGKQPLLDQEQELVPENTYSSSLGLGEGLVFVFCDKDFNTTLGYAHD